MNIKDSDQTALYAQSDLSLCCSQHESFEESQLIKAYQWIRLAEN